MDGEPRERAECPGCRKLRALVARLEAQVEQLKQQGVTLRGALEAAQRAGQRQAAPFRKAEGPKPAPKKPGRTRGDAHGVHAHREPPPPEAIDERYDVPLPKSCPHCGGQEIQETGMAPQYQTDIPRRPLHRQFDIHIGRCARCGQPVQGRHELQTSDAVGAAGAQLGPQAHAALTILNKELGLAHGKVARCFGQLFGLVIARATSVRSVLRTAQRCEPAYEAIREGVRLSPVVVPDETGWRVGGQSAWLHVFVAQHATCYEIDAGRGHDVAERLLGLDGSGVMIHDGWGPYDCFTHARHQPCLAHLKRRCRQILETAVGGAAGFPRRVLDLVDAAFAARRRHMTGRLSQDAMAVEGLGLAYGLEPLLRGRFTYGPNQRLARHLGKHLWHWFWFLGEPGLDATNYRAEQAIRPAVVNRKVWGGNRTGIGARAQSVLMSVLRTCQQRGQSALDYLVQTLCSPRPTPLFTLGR